MDIKNKNPITNAAKEYTAVKINDEVFFFTANEMKVAKQRALKNPEDVKDLHFGLKAKKLASEIVSEMVKRLSNQ